ncbi:F-box only protein 15 [Myripristis murdjan]|uniref:F-box protein 15 n=1 Tax=Myripristis murdjan TaxID=586833 RepID=A0A667ZBY6_9TELE|nr:F-box only protein 15 [Myripristis murdjan]
MATGRKQTLLSLGSDGKPARPLPAKEKLTKKRNKRSGKKPPQDLSSFQRCDGSQPGGHMASRNAGVSTVRLSRPAKKSHRASTLYSIQSLPSEILIKILSYLDASSLFCLSHVSKLFCQLANDDIIWHKKYISEFGNSKMWKPNGTDEVVLKLGKVTVQDRPVGYWKRQYFRAIVGHDVYRWRRELQMISPLTGLPSQTQWVLRNLHVSWELTVSDKSGCEHTFEQAQAHYFQSSVVLCWTGDGWPMYSHISTLQLHGMMRRMSLNCPTLQRASWRSLIAKFDMKTQSAQVIGNDGLVKLIHLQPGIIIGIWRGQCSVAFVMVSLHFHRLMEKSLMGSSACPYYDPVEKAPFDDIDPEYGLHGYTLHFVLHNTVTVLMSSSFSQLFCRRTQIYDGLIQLTAISRSNLAQHIPLAGNINLPWKCEALEGTVENCCMMSLTLLDEFRKPFWCVSSPVSMVLAKSPVCYDYDGTHFEIQHQDSDGQVKMKIICLKEQGPFYLVSLTLYVPVYKVNKHFSRDY